MSEPFFSRKSAIWQLSFATFIALAFGAAKMVTSSSQATLAEWLSWFASAPTLAVCWTRVLRKWRQ